jgi:hypothetical protein
VVSQGNLYALAVESNLCDRIFTAQRTNEDIQTIEHKLAEGDALWFLSIWKLRRSPLMRLICPSSLLLTVYFGAPSMLITLWFGFDYGTNLPLGTLII